MRLFQIETLILSLILSSFSFGAIELKPQSATVTAKHFYNFVNNMPDEDRLESWAMGNYNLFVNMATWSPESQKIQNALYDFARRNQKNIAVVFIYDNVAQNLALLKAQAESTPVHEFFDKERRMYHLFKNHERDPAKFKPSFVFTNPKGQVLFNDYISDLQDLETFANEARPKN